VTESGIDARLRTGDARGSMLLSMGNRLALYDLNIHDNPDVEQPQWLESSTGAGHCSSHVPRSAIVVVIGTRTVYDVENQTLSSIVKTYQREDAFAHEMMKIL
jgi:hypothetical protein